MMPSAQARCALRPAPSIVLIIAPAVGDVTVATVVVTVTCQLLHPVAFMTVVRTIAWTATG